MASEPTRSILNEDVLPYRPRVARETRRLLMTAVLAVLALWVLARIRFPDRPVTSNPVTPLLSQLTGVPNFSDLAAAVEDVRGRIGSSMVALIPADLRASGAQRLDRVPAIRLRDDLAIAILNPPSLGDAGNPPAVVASDRVTGLAVIRVDPDPRGSMPEVWLPQRLERPRYLITSSPAPTDVSLRPAFIGALTPVETAGWSGPVWALPVDTDVSPGAFLFTDEGELVGAVTRYEDGLAVVPGSTLVGSAEELLRTPPKPPVDLGIDVQALTPQLALVSGAQAGVVVTWVDPGSNASDVLRPGDVIKTLDSTDVTTPNQWRVHMARLVPAETVVLGVVRGGASRDIQLKAIAASDPGPASLGLRMRRIPRSGVEVLSVDPGSASDVAGLEAGDVITTIGVIASPTADQVRSAFAAVKRGDVVIAALTRGSEHRVVTLQR